MDWTPLHFMGVLMGALLAALIWKILHDHWQAAEIRLAVNSFKWQREQVEAKFLDLASWAEAAPAVCWIEYEWQQEATFARDLQTGMITAFVALEVHFVAMNDGERGDMEPVRAVCEAAALFHYSQGRWGTSGRGILNTDPDDALIRLTDQFEPVRTKGSVV